MIRGMIAPTDEQLVEAYVAGDGEALRSLIDRYIKPIYAFVHRYIGRDGDAEDVTQDVFVSAWKSIGRFDRQKKFKTWIFAIAKNASLTWIKKKRPALFSELENECGADMLAASVPDSSPLPDELFACADLAGNLRAAMETLNPNYRAVLFLRYNDHFTFREISESLHEPLHTVKSRHRRALSMLKKLLTR